MEERWAEHKKALEREMTPPRPPGFYPLGSEGVIQKITLRDKTQPFGGWTDSISNEKEEKRRKAGFKAWREESGHRL